MKYCKKCQSHKVLKEFPNNSSKLSGKQSSCKDCTAKYLKEWRLKNKLVKPKRTPELLSDFTIIKESNFPQSAEEKFQKYYLTVKGRASHMLNNARARAKRRNFEFELDREWVSTKLRAGRCEVTGIPFNIQINGGRGHVENSFSPSIDRIDPKFGYTKDNCRMVCWIYNRARGAFPDNDFDYMIMRLVESQHHAL